jgi:hypothetical protein
VVATIGASDIESGNGHRGGNGHVPAGASEKARTPPISQHVTFESIGREGDPEDVIAFSVMPVRGVPRDVAAIEQLINAVGAAAGSISLDIAADEARRYLIVRCKRKAAEFVQAQITSIYGSPIFEARSADDPAIRMETGEASGHRPGEAPRQAAPSPVDLARLPENDPVLGLMGAAGSVREGGVSGAGAHPWAGARLGKTLLGDSCDSRRRGFRIVRLRMSCACSLLWLAPGLSYFILAGR